MNLSRDSSSASRVEEIPEHKTWKEGVFFPALLAIMQLEDPQAYKGVGGQDKHFVLKAEEDSTKAIFLSSH